MLASDDQNPEFVGARDPDSVLAVTFYTRAVKNNFKSMQENRPIFEDRVFVRIIPPGDGKNIIDTFANDADKKRFSRQWAHFQNTKGGDSREIGTPVSEWTLLTPSQVEELRGVKFFTVEQIAGASDTQLQSIGMIAGTSPMTLRTRAQAYLAAAKETALPQMQAEELAKRDADIADLKALLAAQGEQIAALTAAKQQEPEKGKQAKVAL